MTASGTAVPELGPLLPALVAPTEATPPFQPQLSPVRLALATTLIEAAATARRAHAAGDLRGAGAALGREVWEAAWTTARHAAAAAVVDAARARIQHAAASARMPQRRLAAVLPSSDEVASTAQRLGREAAPVFLQLDQLEKTAPTSDTGTDQCAGWLREVERTARRIDEAWRQLEVAALDETAGWTRVAATVAAWQPSPWPFRAVAAAIVVLCLVTGLMLGGWIDVPPPLKPIADRIWGLR